MKKTILLFSIITFLSCGTKQVLTAKKDAGGNLVGTTDKALFQKEYGSSWFNTKYDNYKPNEVVIAKLKPLLKGITVKAFMGTWCGDSKRETPPFYKVLDASGFKEKNLTMVTVDYNKKANGLEKGLNIQRVPTFIFFKKGKEIGRMVERRGTTISIEQEILNILTK